MTPELLNKLKHLANIAAHLPHDVTIEDEDATMKALHGELAADTVLELIALADRTTAPVSLTDAKIEELAIKHESFGFGQAGKKSKLSIHGFEPEGLREFARALLAAAPAPIQQEPVAFIVKLKGNPQKVLCWPDMGPRKRQSANLEYTPLYATPPALAGSQVQAAGDEVNEQTIELPEQAPDTSQEWGKLDGATAFHLIERHADGWSEVGHMMESWRSARQRGSRDITLEEVAELIEGQRVMILNPTEPHAEARAQATKDCCKSLAAQIRKMKG